MLQSRDIWVVGILLKYRSEQNAVCLLLAPKSVSREEAGCCGDIGVGREKICFMNRRVCFEAASASLYQEIQEDNPPRVAGYSLVSIEAYI